MSPPSFTYAFASERPASIAASISSATAPATAAIGVMKSTRCGQHAAIIRRGPPRKRIGIAERCAQKRKLGGECRQDVVETPPRLLVRELDLVRLAPC